MPAPGETPGTSVSFERPRLEGDHAAVDTDPHAFFAREPDVRGLWNRLLKSPLEKSHNIRVRGRIGFLLFQP